MNKFYFNPATQSSLNYQIVNRNLRFLKNVISFLMVAILLFISKNQAFGQAQTSTFNTAGNFLWRCPAGVTSITVKCYGGGGGGGRGYTTNGAAGGGGGGGAYASSTISVTPGSYYLLNVGLEEHLQQQQMETLVVVLHLIQLQLLPLVDLAEPELLQIQVEQEELAVPQLLQLGQPSLQEGQVQQVFLALVQELLVEEVVL
jgi:hypothetical protein